MKKITLLCTTHEENGLANADALSSILEHIQPEVIFLESPADAVEDFISSGSRSNLESVSIRRYKESNSTEVIPVDLPTPESSFFDAQKKFSQIIADESTDYRRLTLWNFNYIADYGFPYLNSEHSYKMWEDIYSNIRATLEIIGEPEMSEFFSLWERTNDLRENEMMERILKYCAGNSFERSVFMIGAAHRNSIIKKSQITIFASDLGVEWEYAYY